MVFLFFSGHQFCHASQGQEQRANKNKEHTADAVLSVIPFLVFLLLRKAHFNDTITIIVEQVSRIVRIFHDTLPPLF